MSGKTKDLSIGLRPRVEEKERTNKVSLLKDQILYKRNVIEEVVQVLI